MNGRFTAGFGALAVSLVATATALAISIGIIALSGGPPSDAGRALLDGAFGSWARTAGTLSKMIPLILVALGWIMAFSVRRINIGLEGQILAGGIVAAVIGFGVSGLPGVVHLPLAVVGGVAAGAAYAGIAAVLWVRRGVNEIISTLMLNFVAIQFLNWILRGPLQEATHTFPRSEPIAPSARWPRLLSNTSLSWDLFVALAMIGVVYFVLARTGFGFQLRMTGANEAAARGAGVRTIRVTLLAFLASGGLAGLAGSSLILGGESASMSDNFSAGYGFEGIVVALLGRNSPVGSLPAALLFAALRQGGGLIEARVGVSADLVVITQGAVILLVAGAAFVLERRRARRVDSWASLEESRWRSEF